LDTTFYGRYSGLTQGTCPGTRRRKGAHARQGLLATGHASTRSPLATQGSCTHSLYRNSTRGFDTGFTHSLSHTGTGLPLPYERFASSGEHNTVDTKFSDWSILTNNVLHPRAMTITAFWAWETPIKFNPTPKHGWDILWGTTLIFTPHCGCDPNHNSGIFAPQIHTLKHDRSF